VKSNQSSQKDRGDKADGRAKTASASASEKSQSKEAQSRPKSERAHQAAFAQEFPRYFPKDSKKEDQHPDSYAPSLSDLNNAKAQMDTYQALTEVLQNSSRKSLEENPDDMKAKQSANLAGNLTSWFGNGSKIFEQNGQAIVKNLEKQIENGNQPDLSMLLRPEDLLGSDPLGSGPLGSGPLDPQPFGPFGPPPFGPFSPGPRNPFDSEPFGPFGDFPPLEPEEPLDSV
jgi:hypothetical protein